MSRVFRAGPESVSVRLMLFCWANCSDGESCWAEKEQYFWNYKIAKSKDGRLMSDVGDALEKAIIEALEAAPAHREKMREITERMQCKSLVIWKDWKMGKYFCGRMD